MNRTRALRMKRQHSIYAPDTTTGALAGFVPGLGGGVQVFCGERCFRPSLNHGDDVCEAVWPPTGLEPAHLPESTDFYIDCETNDTSCVAQSRSVVTFLGMSPSPPLPPPLHGRLPSARSARLCLGAWPRRPGWAPTLRWCASPPPSSTLPVRPPCPWPPRTSASTSPRWQGTPPPPLRPQVCVFFIFAPATDCI